MDCSKLINTLNEKQRTAVTSSADHILVLAGAGSGKTRVLVHRIAWLLSVEHVSPYSILSVTFTNKAAAEMRHRVSALMGAMQDGMWTGTFHGLAHRLLRMHYLEANLPKDFQIIDNDDQLRLLKKIIKSLNLDEKRWAPRQAMWYINHKKDQGHRPQHTKNHSNFIENTWRDIYQSYQEATDRAGLVDFSELLLRAYELWLNHTNILDHYQQRWSHILVDEFQDTNTVQYAWIRALAEKRAKVMIVGDDDQSIYGWRGAQVGNIQSFLKDFEGAETVRLEQNYRSTPHILTAANTLIANNEGRMGKNLWTAQKEGEPISLYHAFNELDEARFVAHQIKKWHEKGGQLKDCAILYRSNAQSRVLEEAFLQGNIPHRIYGGHRFFERQEIKDALAYLRLISNRHDDASFERVINTPARGIGERTLSVLRQAARDREKTLWETIQILLHEKILAGRAALGLRRFIELIDSLAYETSEMPLHLQTDRVIKDSGLWLMYQEEKGERVQGRIENLEELVNATQQYDYRQYEDDTLSPLQAFLSDAVLEAGEGQADTSQDSVQMMTLHSAKGLEFFKIFIVGMEEGMFPSKMALNESGRLEEERRLAYVGLTRAMKELTLSYAERRRLYGEEVRNIPSRFIDELPKDCIQQVKLGSIISQPFHSRFTDKSKYKIHSHQNESNENEGHFSLDQRVRHPKFGEGTVKDLEGSGQHARVQVAFSGNQLKWLVVAYARLEII